MKQIIGVILESDSELELELAHGKLWQAMQERGVDKFTTAIVRAYDFKENRQLSRLDGYSL